MPLFEQLDVYHDPTPRSAALNMALDEALLEVAARPAIRFYHWDHPGLSFGYFGKFLDVESYAAERDLVRRWTGGGIVFHGADLTYSLVIPIGTELSRLSSRDVYTAVHSALCEALKDCGRAASLASADSLLDSPACFERPVRSDVLVEDRKVAGAAQRRTRRGLLQQGSIQNVDVSDDLAVEFANQLSGDFQARPLPPEIVDRGCELAAIKYATEAWLLRR